MNIGITFGCFIPLHDGHKSMIQQSRSENDVTIIGICGKTSDRGKNFVLFEDRITLMKQKYGKCEDIKIVIIDDDKIGMDGTFTLQNWIIWSKELFDNADFDSKDKSNQYTWYTGDDSYVDKLESIYPEHKFILLDRSNIMVSGTMIRENPQEYKDMIDPVFVEYLSQKGLLI